MFIPDKSGHQKHTIRNFILGELRKYIRCNTQEFNFLKINKKFDRRLRFCFCKKKSLKILFRKVKHSSRNELLKISSQHDCHGEKFHSSRIEPQEIDIAEQEFQATFSYYFSNLMDNFFTVN